MRASLRRAVGCSGLALIVACAPLAGRAATFRRSLERVASLDPLRASAVYDAHVVGLVYETPLEVDYFARPYRLKAGCCELPEVSADGRVYTLKLREGTRFVDDPCFPGGRGRAVAAADVVFSLNRLADTRNASSGLWLMKDVASVAAPDARTVVITLREPLYVFPWYLTMAYAAVIPPEAPAHYGARFSERGVGSGPYRLARWWRNHKMRFERNVAWRGWNDAADSGARDAAGRPIDAPPYDAIEYLVIDDASTQWLMFLAGEIDFLLNVPRDNWDAVVGADGRITDEMKRRGVVLHTAPALQVDYIGFNLRDPLMANAKLRQALSAATDIPALLAFYQNREVAADTPVPPMVAGRLETPNPYGFDLDHARRLLAEAGYPNGIDPKTGRRLVVTLSVGRANQSARESVELLASFWERIGVKLEAAYMTWDAFLKAVDESRAAMHRMGWVGDYPEAENFLQLFYSKNVSPGPNHCNYLNPAFDAVYEKALRATDPEARAALWREAQKMVLADAPWVLMGYPKQTSLTGPHVRGFVIGDFLYGMEKHLRPAGEARP